MRRVDVRRDAIDVRGESGCGAGDVAYGGVCCSWWRVRVYVVAYCIIYGDLWRLSIAAMASYGRL